VDAIAATVEPFNAGSAATIGAWCVLGSLGLAALAWRTPSLRGTTLVAPWVWSIMSLLAIVAGELLIGLAGDSPPQSWVAPLRFAAAMSTFCPTMAVLGAKRPQDRGWQFIVLSLWVILSLPSFEWLLFSGIQEMHAARFWFLMILIGVGAINGLGTRFWPSSLAYGLGQMALVFSWLPDKQAWLAGANGPLLGVLLIVTAWLLLAAGFPRAGKPVRPPDRVWLDFRDAFGLVWSLRVVERIHASAAMHDWPVTLAWHGFQARHEGAAIEAMPEAVVESLRTLLRRFVSPAWIDARLAEPAADDREPPTLA
jgi:hypothetical protein